MFGKLQTYDHTYRYGQKEIVRKLSLQRAVAFGKLALVKQMLAEGTDPQARDEQVRTIAASHRFL